MTETAYQRVIAALESHGHNVRTTGSQRAQARCPHHEDRNPSLAVTGITGSVLLHCHAGCDTNDVLSDLGLTKADLYDNPRGVDYRYQGGRIVHRTPDKRFRQSGNTQDRSLYRLSQVTAAVAAGANRIFICEGEQDVRAIEAAGGIATTSPMGAGKWSKIDPTPLTGANVVIVADKDDPGRKHAAEVAASLATLAAAVTVVEAADGCKDAADHIAAGHTLDEFVPASVASVASVESPPSQDGQSKKKPAGKAPAPSAATVIADMALAGHRLGISTDGEAFAVPLDGPKIVRPLRGGKLGLRAELSRRFREATGTVAPQQALADALIALEGEANGSEPERLSMRVAEHGGALWLDLGDNTGRAVRVDGDGWTIHNEPPMLFRRSALTAALPDPVPGGDLADLWSMLNVAEQDRPLIAAWLVSVLMPDIPHPIPAMVGEFGTGKTTAARLLATLLDPSPVPVRSVPKDLEAWSTAAAGSWVVVLDNLSAVSDWFSDALCRAVTGDGTVKRQLYTDGDLIVIAFRRCVVLTGIDLGTVRGDLAERLMAIDLHVIEPKNRRTEAEIILRWDELRPALLGAVLDLTARVASLTPSLDLDEKPRMADFAKVLAAVDESLNTSGLARYVERADSFAVDSLTGDPFVTTMATQLTAGFAGTSAELLDEVKCNDDRTPKEWPKTARDLTGLLKRQAPVMRRAGWTVDELPPGHGNAIRWGIARPEIAGKPHSQHSQHSQDGADTAADAHPKCSTCAAPLLLRVAGRTTCERCRLGVA